MAGANKYIRTGGSGSDGNNGDTYATAYATFGTALTNVDDGGTIWVGDGTWTANTATLWDYSSLKTTTIKAYTDATPVLDASGSTGTNLHYFLYVHPSTSTRKTITFEGITFSGTASFQYGNGSFLYQASGYIDFIFNDCTFEWGSDSPAVNLFTTWFGQDDSSRTVTFNNCHINNLTTGGTSQSRYDYFNELPNH